MSVVHGSTAPEGGHRPGVSLLGTFVDAGTYGQTVAEVMGWAERRESRFVCAANVHMVMEAWDQAAFRHVLAKAAKVTSDGMPLVWLLRRRGFPGAGRVYGPTLMLHLCEAAAKAGVSIGLFGGTPEMVEILKEQLPRRFPGLRVALAVAPVFGTFSPEQESGYVEALSSSGAGLIFVALGCPRQETWMASVSSKVPGVMVGVGAAFAFHAGKVRQAPLWMQRSGLEWLFRLGAEPTRLWKRYLWNNPRFVCLALWEQVTGRWRAL